MYSSKTSDKTTSCYLCHKVHFPGKNKKVEGRKKKNQVTVKKKKHFKYDFWNLNAITPLLSFFFFISITHFSDLCVFRIHNILASPTWPKIIFSKEQFHGWYGYFFEGWITWQLAEKHLHLGPCQLLKSAKKAICSCFTAVGSFFFFFKMMDHSTWQLVPPLWVQDKRGPPWGLLTLKVIVQTQFCHFYHKKSTLSQLVEIFRCDLRNVFIIVWLLIKEQRTRKAIS